jgi:hypothetical protein
VKAITSWFVRLSISLARATSTRATGADRLHRLGRHDPELGPRLERRELDLQQLARRRSSVQTAPMSGRV